MRSLMLIVALAGYSGIVFAQAAPVKMGLWEKKMTMDMGAGAPTQFVSKSCVTPATWQEMMANMSKAREGCTMDHVKTAHGYTIAVALTPPQSSGFSSVTD